MSFLSHFYVELMNKKKLINPLRGFIDLVCSPKTYENGAVWFMLVPEAGFKFWLVQPLNQSVFG